MLKEIIKKEILEHLMGLRFAIACLLCLCVVSISISVRGLDFVQELDDYGKNVVLDRHAIESVGAPWKLWEHNNLVRFPPGSMKMFVQGIGVNSGTTVSLMRTMPAQIMTSDIVNTSIPLFPSVDMVFFIGIILSLMAIVFGYNAISGEKENGTLRLLLSYGVPRDIVLAGKWIGGYITLVVPFLLTALAMAAIIMVNKNIPLSSDEWLRFFLLLAVGLVYIAAIYSLALWISALTHRSSTSIVTLTALWIVLVLALPNLTPYVLGIFNSDTNKASVLSKELVEAKRSIWNRKYEQNVKAYDLANGFGVKWWKNYDWKNTLQFHRAILRFKNQAIWGKEAHLEIMQTYGKLESDFERRLVANTYFEKWLSRLSPYSCFSMAAMGLAGEDIDEQLRRSKQLREFHYQYLSYVYDEDIKAEDYLLTLNGSREIPWSERRKSIPQFVYAPSSISVYVKPILLDTALLFVFTFVFIFLSYAAFSRYDVR